MKSSLNVLVATCGVFALVIVIYGLARDNAGDASSGALNVSRESMQSSTETPTHVPTPDWMLVSSRAQISAMQTEAVRTPVPYEEPSLYSSPIYTATEALSRTLALLSPAVTVTQEEVRLISYDTLQQQFHGLSSVEEYISSTPTGPVWLVGILGDGMDRTMLIDSMPDDPLPTPPPQPVDGLYFAWDANLGQKMEQGVLQPGGYKSMAVLIGISNESLTISPATPDAP